MFPGGEKMSPELQGMPGLGVKVNRIYHSHKPIIEFHDFLSFIYFPNMIGKTFVIIIIQVLIVSVLEVFQQVTDFKITGFIRS